MGNCLERNIGSAMLVACCSLFGCVNSGDTGGGSEQQPNDVAQPGFLPPVADSDSSESVAQTPETQGDESADNQPNLRRIEPDAEDEEEGTTASQADAEDDFEDEVVTVDETDSDAPQEEPDGADPCMGLDYLGQCNGDVSEWCGRDNTLKRLDCSAMNQRCGWVDDQIGWYCGGSPNVGPDENAVEPEVEDPASETSMSACGTEIEAEVVEWANRAREEEGLNTLECDANMTTAARLHSQDMCDQGYFSHESLDGRSPWDRMREQGVSFFGGAENIARGQRSPESVHGSWMNSPGHRANILRGGLSRIGVGFVDCNGARYWTQVFAN